jgi:hypothetical protein
MDWKLDFCGTHYSDTPELDFEDFNSCIKASCRELNRMHHQGRNDYSKLQPSIFKHDMIYDHPTLVKTRIGNFGSDTLKSWNFLDLYHQKRYSKSAELCQKVNIQKAFGNRLPVLLG